jgi:transcription factor IIIB subunit 2
VVHISHGVVTKRLNEFANTPSGSLTVDEFNSVDLEKSEDPPAFQESKKKRLEEELRKRDEERADNLASEV